MDVRELLEKVKTGAVDIEDAQKVLKDLPYEDLGYAKLDHHRKTQIGIWRDCVLPGKTRRISAGDLQAVLMSGTGRCWEQGATGETV